ncbi:MAG: hypothetical protein J6J86_08030 [Lachnospiraceae bacterium]|nr:hypothetical protein [Lachnospiraceae bacterium]
MKKLMIRILLLLFVFAGVFAGVYFYQNRKTDEEVIQMDKATLPVMYIMYGEERINRLHGYVRKMDATSMRDSLTPLKEDRKVVISIDTYGSHLTGISYEVRSLDTERLIEKTAVTEWESKDGTAEAVLSLENLISAGEEYLLTIHLSTEEDADTTYYTRILMGVEAVEEKLAFVQDFSSTTFDKEEAERLIMYLESGSKGDNTNYGNVNIYSSFDQITWGRLAPVKLSEPVPTITEINGNVTCFRLDYQVEIKNMYGTTEACNVSEFYRTNYTPDRTYLLTFERTMNQRMRAVSENVGKSRLNLGISSTTDIPLITNADGSITAFVKERELWRYDSRNNLLECIFSFRDLGDDGVRDEWNQHEIRPIQIDEAGNMYFAVYGYMNRGAHEGEVGVAIYRYLKDGRTVEEVFFLPYTKSYEYLLQNMGELFHITPANRLCFLIDGSLYSVDLASLEYVELISGLKEGCYVINKDGNTIAWQPEHDITKSKEIRRLQLDTNTEDTIKAEALSIKVIGFVENDLIYGSVREEDIRKTAAGDVRAYMSRLFIVDKNGHQVGNYYKDGYYFTEALIKDNMITLSRYKLSEEGEFEEAPEDYITNNTLSGTSKLSVTMIATELKKKEAGINLLENAAEKSLEIEYSSEVIYPEGRILKLEGADKGFPYYVYAKGRLIEAMEEASHAVQLADAQMGVVVQENGSYLWKRGNKNTSKTLSVSMPETEAGSMAKALEAMLRYAGVSSDTAAMLEQGMLPMEIIDAELDGRGLDLSGCTLRQILYFVDSGRPVLAKVGEEEYVLVVGFDSYNALLLDTTGRKAYKIGLEDGTKLFEKAGNEFMTYGTIQP